jgi:plasmid maintenance system antidote protein VapI
MAPRIEKAFGVKMDTLMRMQASYDIAKPASARSKSMCAGFPKQQTYTHEESATGMGDP